MADFFKLHTLTALERGLDGAVTRQAALAANMANASTPRYQEVAVGFEEQLSAAMGQRFAMAETDPRHLPNGMQGAAGVRFEAATAPGIARLDGNTVNLERTMTASATNTIHYNAMIAAYKKEHGQLMTVLSAAGGGKGR